MFSDATWKTLRESEADVDDTEREQPAEADVEQLGDMTDEEQMQLALAMSLETKGGKADVSNDDEVSVP